MGGMWLEQNASFAPEMSFKKEGGCVARSGALGTGIRKQKSEGHSDDQT